jgi:hypothetical protein
MTKSIIDLATGEKPDRNPTRETNGSNRRCDIAGSEDAHPIYRSLGDPFSRRGEGVGAHRRVVREDLKRPPGNIQRPTGLKIA